jgi:hypothetical protein
MRSIRLPYLTACACVALVAVSGCTRNAPDQMSWARAALERNGDIEIVATDPQTRTFTVRDKASGALRMVRADELVAGAAAATQSPAAALAAAATTAAAAAAPPTAPAWRSDTDSANSAPEQPAQPAPATAAAAAAAVSDSGRVLESGPGYSIRAAAPPVSGGAAAANAAMTSAAVERRHDPIVCQGARLLHIDNRNLVFDGDAVSAEDGCEIHITNSRITAAGVGVSARAASVYVDNSQIEGNAASIDASQGAQVYAESSRFRGLSRRLDTATLHDLGGNVWN